MKKVNFKDTEKENTPPNKTQELKKSTNRDIWVIVTLNQLFIKSLYTRIKIKLRDKNPVFELHSELHFELVFLFFSTVALDPAVLNGNVAFSVIVLSI